MANNPHLSLASALVLANDSSGFVRRQLRLYNHSRPPAILSKALRAKDYEIKSREMARRAANAMAASRNAYEQAELLKAKVPLTIQENQF